jgi:hypothetical protein
MNPKNLHVSSQIVLEEKRYHAFVQEEMVQHPKGRDKNDRLAQKLVEKTDETWEDENLMPQKVVEKTSETGDH